MRSRIYQGRAITLGHNPIEGPPETPVTFALYDRDDNVIVAETAAEVGAVNTELDESVVAGERILTLESVSDIVAAGRYWVGYDEEPKTRERVRVRRLSPDPPPAMGTGEVELVEPVQFDHALGDFAQFFRDGRIFYDLTALVTAGLPVQSLYRVEWTYEVDGEPQYATTYLDVVLRRFQLQLDEDDIATRIPLEVRQALRGEYEQARLLNAAEEDVLRWLRGHNYTEPDRIADVDQFDQMGILAMKVILLDRIVAAGDASFLSALQDARKQWKDEGDNILREGVALLTAAESLAASDGESYVKRLGRGPRRILGALGP